MGFFKKLKNAITGSSVELTLSLDTKAVLGQEIEVHVKARVGNEPVKMKGAYLQLRGTEIVEIPWAEIEALGVQRPPLTRSVDKFVSRETTFSKDLRLNGPEELAADSEHEWSGKILLPEDGFPTFTCRKTHHVWATNAFIEVATVNPSADWHEIEVKAE